MENNNNALPAGKLLKSAERTYRIVKTLGAGGFGITYLVEAQSVENGQVSSFFFAMKEHFITRCCERSQSDSKIVYSNPVREEVINSQKDFLAEAARLQQVGRRHPNIVDVCDIFEANNTAYYVMDYLHGQSLRQYVNSRGALSPQEAVAMIAPIIDAIGFLHANRMTHLDIKPDNIMLTTAPEGGLMPVLIDFGLSKHYDESGTPTSTINTLACSDGYSPIEQYGGITTFSPTADIYALGATLLFTLTGRDPRKSTEMTPAELNASLAMLPPALAQLIAAMMNSNRLNRPQNAGEVLAYLQQYNMMPAPGAPAPAASAAAYAAPAAPAYNAPAPAYNAPAPAYNAPDNNATVPLGGGAGMPPAGGNRPAQPYAAAGRPAPAPRQPKKQNKTVLFIALGAAAVVVLGIIAAVLIWLFGGNIHDYDRVPSAVDRYVDLTSDPTSDQGAQSLAMTNSLETPLQVFLMWSGDRDLDLIVHAPNGQETDRNNTESGELGAYFSGDAFGGSHAMEYVSFATPASGQYDVFATTMSVIPENGTEVRVVVIENGNPRTYKARLVPNDEGVSTYMLASFDYTAGEATVAEQDEENVVVEEVDPEETPLEPAAPAPRNDAPAPAPVAPNPGVPAPSPSPATGSNRWQGPYSYSSGDNVENYYTLSGMTSGNDAAAQRRASGLTGSGPIKISLLWDTNADMDLYVNTPGGTDVYWFSRDDNTTGGHHSGDNLGNGSGSFESISFSSPTNGTYDVFVRVGTGAVGDRFKVVVKNGSNVRTYACTVPSFTGNQRYIKIAAMTASGYSGRQQGTSPTTNTGGWGYVDSGTTSYSHGSFISRYRLAHPYTGHDATAQRRASNATGSGPLKITLLWDSSNDLDLCVNDPAGTDIYYGNRTKQSTGANHTGDQMGGSNSYESISWSNPGNGLYDVFVRCRGTVPSGGLPVKVVIKAGTSVTTYAVKLPEGNGTDYKIAGYSYSGGGSPNNDIPSTHGNASTSSYSSGNTVTSYIRANVSTTHNTSLERRARNLSGSATLRVTAFWDCSGDIDLIVNTHNGTDVYFANTTDSTTGAHFSGDQFGGNGSYESIRFTNPRSGLYDVFVRARSGFESGGKVTVVINDGSSNYTYTTRIYPHGETRDYKITGYSR